MPNPHDAREEFEDARRVHR